MRPKVERFLLGLGLVPVAHLIDCQSQLRQLRTDNDRLAYYARIGESVQSTVHACPECGAEVDGRTAEAL